MIVTNRRKLTAGILALVGFFVVLTLWMSPLAGERTGLQWADDFFNRLSKNSSDYMERMKAECARYEGRRFEASAAVRKPEDAARLAGMLSAGGLQASADADGRAVRFSGDLGLAGRAAVADADALFHDRGAELEDRYKMPGREAVYWWWTAFDGVYKSCVKARDVQGSNFASSVMTRACEPAYNFAGIPATAAAEAKGRLVLLLGFYLVYTVWYGFAIMWIFEGLGIVPRHKGRKAEA
jgi:hypothetical protein